MAYESDGNNIIFGECKYLKNKMDCAVFYALLEKKKAVDWKKDSRKEWYILCSIEGYSDELKALAENRDDLLLL